MKTDKLGWLAAAAMAGAIFGMGFHAPGDKTGTVDVVKVFKDSDYAKIQNEGLQAQVAARRDIVQFVQANRNMKGEDADKLRTLSTKDKLTPTDKADIDRIKMDAQGDEKKARDLQTKEKPTPAELTQIEDYTKRKDATGQRLDRWREEFNTELTQQQEKMNGDALIRVRQVIQQVARDQGYSIVFAQEVAPYSANDLTAEALKAMNAKK